MWIHRRIERDLTRAAEQRPAVVLTGARQVGKSSLLRRCFPGHHYVSLDLPSEAHSAEHEPALFLERNPLPLIVDEVQYAPGLFRHVKRVIDEHRERHGAFLLTGSQKFALMQNVSESLAGRAALLELSPLDIHEIRSSGADASVPHLLLRGGYPELWADPSLDARAFLSAYVATYIERDVRSMLRIGSLHDFERFLRACALRSGQVLNKNDLARDVGVSGPTANEWLSVLEASGIVALLEPWFANGTKRIAKAPKLYLCDTGLLCFLLNVRTTAELISSPLRGAIFETAAFAELHKHLARTDERRSLFYYRDRNMEVDFVIHRAGRFALLESKWSENPGLDDLSNLDRLAHDIGEDRIASRQLVCRAPNPHALGSGRAVTLETMELD